MPHARSHRVDEPTGLFLGAVASPQSRPPLYPAGLIYNRQIQNRSCPDPTQHFFYSRQPSIGFCRQQRSEDNRQWSKDNRQLAFADNNGRKTTVNGRKTTVNRVLQTTMVIRQPSTDGSQPSIFFC